VTAPFDQQIAAIDRKAQPIVIGGVRILAGLLWLANLHWKVPGDFGEDNGGGLYKYSLSVTRHSPFGPFAWLTEEVVLPNFTLFGWFTLVLETTLAALLLIGYKTKIVGLVSAMAAIPIFLSVLYYDRTYEWSWSYFLMMGMGLLLYASDAGRHMGLDGALDKPDAGRRRSLRTVGIVGTVVGVLGLFVARSIDVAGSTVALLGSDAGFVNDSGDLERRWELKLVFFNPLWALLTIACGVLIVLGVKQVKLAYLGAGGYLVLAVVAFVTRTYDYARDDGAIQKIGTGQNVALWAALALGGLLLARSLDGAANTTHDQ
jgi:thiosulfate dehydrogenase (quinone) large subunit